MDGNAFKKKGIVASMQTLVRPARSGDEAAVLALLARHKGLEMAFAAEEFLLAVDGPHVRACGRLRRHPDGALELASIATEPGHHGAGLGSAVVHALLSGVADGSPVYALALAPGFFARFGFREVPRGDLPASVRDKAEGMCASQPFVAMARP